MKCGIRRLMALGAGFTLLVGLLPQVTQSASAAVGDITEFGLPQCTVSPMDPFGRCVPIGISHGPDGNLWVVTNFSNDVLKMSTAGIVLNKYHDPVGQGLFHIQPGNDGAMWYTEIQGGPGIGRIPTSGTPITEIQTPTPNSGPLTITVGLNARMIWTENGAGNIGRNQLLTPPYNPIEKAIPTPNSAPGDIVIGSLGFMWFSETGADKIGYLRSTGGAGLCGQDVCEFNVPAGSVPEGMVKGADGNMWFTEHGNGDGVGGGKIGVMSPYGVLLAEYPLPSGPTAAAGSMIHGPSGDSNLYFTEEGTAGVTPAAIGRINPSTHVITEFRQGIQTDAVVANLTVGPDNNIWFSEPNADTIGRMSLH